MPSGFTVPSMIGQVRGLLVMPMLSWRFMNCSDVAIADVNHESARAHSRKQSPLGIQHSGLLAGAADARNRPCSSTDTAAMFPQREGREHVRRIGRRRGVQIGAIELAEARDAEKPERADHLVLHDFEHAHDAGLARRGEPVTLHAAEPDQIGAERDAP